jgi:protein-L-isoaspartate O-methyltransferase
MIIPLGSKESQDLVLVRREDGEIQQEIIQDGCTFVPLLGRFAWTSEHPEGGA